MKSYVDPMRPRPEKGTHMSGKRFLFLERYCFLNNENFSSMMLITVYRPQNFCGTLSRAWAKSANLAFSYLS